MVICSVHLKATGLTGGALEATQTEALTVYKIAETVAKLLKNEKDIAIVGDFNMSPDCPGKNIPCLSRYGCPQGKCVYILGMVSGRIHL